MTVRLKNTALDRLKHVQHRTAPRLEMEPSIAGARVRLNSTLDITDESYAQNKALIDGHVNHGVLEVIFLDGAPAEARKAPPLDGNGLRLDGPTLEEWTAAGYKPEGYPPVDYAEKPSPALTKFREEQAAAVKAAAEAARAAEEKAAAEAKMLEENRAKQAAEIAASVGKKIVDDIVDQIDDTPPENEPAPTTPTETKKSKKSKLF